MFNKELNCKTGPKTFSGRILILFLISFYFSLTVDGQQKLQYNRPQLTIEQTIGYISAEFGLTGREQLILQPIINEIAVYNRAMYVLSGQRIAYLNSLRRKITYLYKSKKAIINFGHESVIKECALRKNLYYMLESYVNTDIYDPEAKERSAFTRPWNWVKRKDLRDMRLEMERRNRELTDQWVNGDSSFPFTWPGYNWSTENKLENSIETEKKKIREFSEKYNIKNFSISYPILGWTKWEQLNESTKKAKERLIEIKTKINNGTLNIQSKEINDKIFLIYPYRTNSDDLKGWVTQKTIREKIIELEKKKASIRAQYGKNTLKIFRNHTGWTTGIELKKSLDEIKAKVKEVSDKIYEGSYGVYFPGPKKMFSCSSVDQEIKKTSDLIESIRANKSYSVPVLGFGWSLRREDIYKASKQKGLTKKQRTNLREGLRRLGAVQALEINYHKTNLAFLNNNVRSEIYDSSLSHMSHFSTYRTDTAMPFFYFHSWDSESRKKVSVEFAREMGHYQLYYNLKIDHLRKCLKLF